MEIAHLLRRIRLLVPDKGAVIDGNFCIRRKGDLCPEGRRVVVIGPPGCAANRSAPSHSAPFAVIGHIRGFTPLS